MKIEQGAELLPSIVKRVNSVRNPFVRWQKIPLLQKMTRASSARRIKSAAVGVKNSHTHKNYEFFMTALFPCAEGGEVKNASH
jgi:hypothetical protein